uniref:Uncharacterized protein n=1 Tax=Spermophilus dauricus TaxID=99837 RepID=A0A8C9QLI9_SPEDA
MWVTFSRGLCPVLCLGQRSHTQEGALPRPSISAEPGSVIPRGRPVTIVCQGPARAQEFCLEKEGRPQIWGKRTMSPSEQEARFLFPSMRGFWRTGFNNHSDLAVAMLTPLQGGLRTAQEWGSTLQVFSFSRG